MTRPTIAEVNLSSIQQNVIQLKRISPNSLCYPVVKANAYGHGLKKVVEAIDALINGYCVATSEEAINLRRLTSKSIVCLEGPYDSNELRSLILKKIDFVIHSSRQLIFLNKEEIPRSIKIWLKLDTGMNRLGFNFIEAKNAYLKILKKTNNIVLMSHFSSAAGTKTSLDKSKKQIQDFSKLEKKLKKLGGNTLSSLCNSGGLLNYKKSHKDIMRPGIAIFGVNQKEIGKKITLKPALTLKSKFISIKEVKKGGKVGYDGSWSAKKDSVIGILPIGYADGYPVTLSNNGYVLVNGKKANVIGRVSMDLIAIDLTSLSNIDYESVVILYGKGLPIEVISKLAGIIPYSLMTSLTERVKKKYI